MASGGNTWFKKLEHKRKVFEMKRAKGNEKGVMAFCARVKNVQARDMDRKSIEDKPGVTPPGKPKDKTPLPRTPGWQPTPFMNPKLAKRIARYDVKHGE